MVLRMTWTKIALYDFGDNKGTFGLMVYDLDLVLDLVGSIVVCISPESGFRVKAAPRFQSTSL